MQKTLAGYLNMALGDVPKEMSLFVTKRELYPDTTV
jgi:hypothetical protein